MNKSYITLIGFLLFSLGFLSIIFSLVGLNFQILGFLTRVGAGFAFLIHIIMMLAGAIVMYMSKVKG